MARGYQHGFSEMHAAAMYDEGGRRRKADTMVAILADHFGADRLKGLAVLDVGASTGLIDSFLAPHFGSVHGIDIDASAIAHAQSRFAAQGNLHFKQGDAMDLPYPENHFDIVICSQIYEHVPDADRMMANIHKVLKPGGVCYFAAGNRLDIHEHHYNLPFLSAIPRPLGHLYVRLAGKADYYYEKHLSYWGLRRLTRQFSIIDYTRRTIDDPERFRVDYMLKPGSPKQRLARIIARLAYWLVPGYLWLLRKPG